MYSDHKENYWFWNLGNERVWGEIWSRGKIIWVLEESLRFVSEKGKETWILEGEILPWSVLGVNVG